MAIPNTISGFFGGGGATPPTTTDDLQVVSTNGNTEKNIDVVLSKTIGSKRNRVEITASGGISKVTLSSRDVGTYGEVEILIDTMTFSRDGNFRLIRVKPNEIYFEGDTGVYYTTLKYSPLGTSGVGTSQRMASVIGILALNEMPLQETIYIDSPSTTILNVENGQYYLNNINSVASTDLTFSDTIPNGANFWVLWNNTNPCTITLVGGGTSQVFCPQGLVFTDAFFLNVFKANGNFYVQTKIA